MNKYGRAILKHGLIVFIVAILPISSVVPFLKDDSESFWAAGIFSSFLVLSLFYLNYFWLAPNFYFRNKKLAYLFFTATSLVLAVVSMRLVLSSIGFEDDFFTSYSRKLGNFITLRIVLTFSFSWFLLVYERFEKEKAERKGVELELLKAQYSPHFLFNALNSIYAKTIVVSDDASSLILKLSALLRYNLNHTSSARIPLNEEIDSINYYIDLQMIRLPETVRVEREINVPETHQLISPYMLIPLIENAFKYGVNTGDLCRIYISLSLDDQRLSVYIRNEKQMIDNALVLPEGFGLGLSNVRKLLELNYPSNHRFVIDDSNGWFTVHLEILLE